MVSAYCPSFLRLTLNRIERSPIGLRMARGAFWSIVGAVISRGMGMAAGIFTARILGKEAYGQLGIINNTMGMFGAFAGFGLGLTATRYVAEFREKNPLKAGRILTMSAVVYWITAGVAALLLFIFAPWLAANTLAAPQLAGGLRIGSLLLLLSAINGGQFGALSGFEAFKRLSIVSIWTGLANFPCVILGCKLLGLEGALWGAAVANIISVVITRWAIIAEARRYKVPLFAENWTSELPLLWKFSLPTLAAGLLVTPVIWFCQTLLARQHAGYGGLAEYTVGASWRGLVAYLPGLLCSAYLPVATSLHSGSQNRNRRFMWISAATSMGLTLFTALAVFAASPWILRSYGSGFSNATWVFALMLATGVIDATNAIFLQTLLASGRAYLRLVSNSIWCALMLGFSFWLVPRYGGIGLATAIFCAQTVHLCIQIPLTLSVSKQKAPS